MTIKDLLGRKGKDKITGLSGIIMSIGIYLTGQVKLGILSDIGSQSEPDNYIWVDINRVQVDIDTDPIVLESINLDKDCKINLKEKE